MIYFTTIMIKTFTAIFIIVATVGMANVASADSLNISLFEIAVTKDSSSISLNVPADFIFTNIDTKNQVEILFDNCTVSILGKNSVLVPSFSPLFEYVELTENPFAKTSKLTIQMTQSVDSHNIYIRQSENLVSFEFRAIDFVSPGLMAHAPDTEQIKKSPRIPAKRSFKVTSAENTGQDNAEKNESINPVVNTGKAYSESSAESELAQNDNFEVNKSIQNVSLEISSEISIVNAKDLLPKAQLEAIHYSEGRIDRDVITLEFTSQSPVFTSEYDDYGSLVIVLHNLITPVEILPDDFVKRQIQGTILNLVSLERFSLHGGPGLKITLSTTEKHEFKIYDLRGIIEIILLKDND